MDADVEPVPCRDCGTPTLPNMGWCQPCDEKHRLRAESGPRENEQDTR